MTQEKALDALTGLPHVLCGGLAGANEIAHRLMRFVRHPDRDLIDQIAVVRHRCLQQHMRPVRTPHQAIGRRADEHMGERRDVAVRRLLQ